MKIEPRWFTVNMAAIELNCHIDAIWHLIEDSKLFPLVALKQRVQVTRFSTKPQSKGDLLIYDSSSALNMYVSPEALRGYISIEGHDFMFHKGMRYDINGLIVVPRVPESGEQITGAVSYRINEPFIITDENLVIPCSQLKKLTTSTTKPLVPTKKPGSLDALGKVIKNIRDDFVAENNRVPQYTEVLSILKKLAKTGKHQVIQEYSEGKLHWKNSAGVEKSTSIKQIQNRLTSLNSAQK